MVNETISLPMHSELDENQIDYISSSIKSFLKTNEMRISIVFIFLGLFTYAQQTYIQCGKIFDSKKRF